MFENRFLASICYSCGTASYECFELLCGHKVCGTCRDKIITGQATEDLREQCNITSHASAPQKAFTQSDVLEPFVQALRDLPEPNDLNFLVEVKSSTRLLHGFQIILAHLLDKHFPVGSPLKGRAAFAALSGFPVSADGTVQNLPPVDDCLCSKNFVESDAINALVPHSVYTSSVPISSRLEPLKSTSRAQIAHAATSDGISSEESQLFGSTPSRRFSGSRKASISTSLSPSEIDAALKSPTKTSFRPKATTTPKRPSHNPSFLLNPTSPRSSPSTNQKRRTSRATWTSLITPNGLETPKPRLRSRPHFPSSLANRQPAKQHDPVPVPPPTPRTPGTKTSCAKEVYDYYRGVQSRWSKALKINNLGTRWHWEKLKGESRALILVELVGAMRWRAAEEGIESSQQAVFNSVRSDLGRILLKIEGLLLPANGPLPLSDMDPTLLAPSSVLDVVVPCKFRPVSSVRSLTTSGSQVSVHGSVRKSQSVPDFHRGRMAEDSRGRKGDSLALPARYSQSLPRTQSSPSIQNTSTNYASDSDIGTSSSLTDLSRLSSTTNVSRTVSYGLEMARKASAGIRIRPCVSPISIPPSENEVEVEVEQDDGYQTEESLFVPTRIANAARRPAIPSPFATPSTIRTARPTHRDIHFPSQQNEGSGEGEHEGTSNSPTAAWSPTTRSAKSSPAPTLLLFGGLPFESMMAQSPTKSKLKPKAPYPVPPLENRELAQRLRTKKTLEAADRLRPGAKLVHGGRDLLQELRDQQAVSYEFWGKRSRYQEDNWVFTLSDDRR